MQKSNRKFAFIINYGIEYRMFLISGLLEKLSKENEVVVITRNIDNKYLEEYKETYKFKTIILEDKYFNKSRLKIENIFQSIRNSRLRLLGKSPFKNYNIKEKKINKKDYIKGNYFTFKTVKTLTLNKIKKHYKDASLKKVLLENNITDIVMSGYSSTTNINFAINGKNSNIKVWSFINSWKDYYINDFLPYKATGFFVWSESMKNDFLSTNSHINSKTIHSSGNIVFDRFYDLKSTFDKSFYEKKYKFKPTTRIFLYCMLDPDRYEKEEEIILLISKKLKEKIDDFKILVKKNPFDSTEKNNKFFKNDESISVLEHFSQRDKEKDFFIQSNDGEKEWIDILNISNFVLGAASTVALESIMLKKPVFTIGFNKDGNKDEFLTRLSNIDFYKDLLNRDDIFLFTTVDELINEINLDNDYNSNKNNLPKILGKFDGKALNRVINIIKEEN